MAPLPPPRRPAWLPAAALLAGATLAGVTAAWLLGAWWPGARVWWVYLGLVLAAILGLGAAERFLVKHAAPRPPRSRGRLKVIPGGKSAFDIEKDDPENPPRWLM